MTPDEYANQRANDLRAKEYYDMIALNEGVKSKVYKDGNIIGLLIESIKELKAEIEELKKDK